MSVTVSDRSDFARTADFELNFLVGMEIWATVCINRFHFDEGKILAVRLERGPIRSDTRPGRFSRRSEDGFCNLVSVAETDRL